MASATLSAFKTKSRVRIALKSEPIAEPSAAPTPPPEPIPELITTLEYLAKKNPELTNLIAVLDLIKVSQSRNIAANSETNTVVEADIIVKPPEPNPETTPKFNLKKLQVIALKCLPGYDGYSEEQAIKRICTHTSVSIERARKGLTLMVEHEILELTPSGIYYLFDTAPF
jgi:hypothetical protein